MKHQMLKTIDDLAHYYKTKNPRTNAYYDAFAQRQATYPHAIMWNWSAFFGTFLWLLYRKAYRATALLTVVQCLLAQQSIGFCMATPLAFGLLGNTFYFWDLKMRAAAGSKATGTSLRLPVLSLVLGIPLALLFALGCLVITFLPALPTLLAGFTGLKALGIDVFKLVAELLKTAA